MNKVIVRAPVRADLAGGTLDLWPIYLFHPGSRTVNVAISYYAESEVTETGNGAIEIHLTDQQYRQRYESMQEMSSDPKAALLHRAIEHFKLTGIHITTRTDAPRGSGLGGSSALAITLVRALSEVAGAPIDGELLINTVRDLETRLLGVPAGIQDYYPPVYGGLASLHLQPGALAREWENRKALIDGISTPEIDSAINAAVEAGAWGGKVCGAGGGGCVVFLFPPERREAVVRALSTVPGRVLDAVPVSHGLVV